MTRGLRRQQGAPPLRLHQFLLHFDVLLPQQGQVLLQFLHLLCTAGGERIGEEKKQGRRGARRGARRNNKGCREVKIIITVRYTE